MTDGRWKNKQYIRTKQQEVADGVPEVLDVTSILRQEDVLSVTVIVSSGTAQYRGSLAGDDWLTVPGSGITLEVDLQKSANKYLPEFQGSGGTATLDLTFVVERR